MPNKCMIAKQHCSSWQCSIFNQMHP
uniref:Uncharacterized protein n=1 Tax=Arundo donax TaxID=35708 RepID=A0A0A9FMG3_ARUDO